MRVAAAIVALLMLACFDSAVSPASAPAAATEQQATQSAKPATMSTLLAHHGLPVGERVVIGGLGSSVGNGATLQHRDRDAPVQWFAADLRRRTPGGAMADITVVNGSVDGSTIHDGLKRDWAVLQRAKPDIVVLAYGMNDGASAQFDSGETYAGAMHDLRALIADIRASGAVPVILTTPGPHTGRTDWSYSIGQTVPQHPPISTDQPVRQVPVPGVGVAPESTRHAAVNEGFRLAADDLGVDLIDVEPFWLHAVAARGQDELFDSSEFVHPNLLGHQLSYHAAIDAAFASYSWKVL